jgi:nitroreductase/NAD-dependent dihydropyrimidine dehydrogenase PreA subunit
MAPPGESVSISADPSRCRHCGICESICPNDVFRWEGDRIDTRLPGRCILCGHCVAVCGEGALVHSALPGERFTDISSKQGLDAEALTTFFARRRSCRRFKTEAVPADILRRLIDVTRFAPTATNAQNVRFVVVDEPAAIAQLEQQTAHYYLKLDRQLKNPVKRFAIRLAVGRRAVEGYRYHLPAIAARFRAVLSEEKRVFYGAPAVVIAYASGLPYIAQASCNLAVMELLLAAEAMGLGTCYNGYLLTAMLRDRRVKRAAGVPEGYTPGAALALGYPDVVFHRSPPRRKPRINTSGK